MGNYRATARSSLLYSADAQNEERTYVVSSRHCHPYAVFFSMRAKVSKKLE